MDDFFPLGGLGGRADVNDFLSDGLTCEMLLVGAWEGTKAGALIFLPLILPWPLRLPELAVTFLLDMIGDFFCLVADTLSEVEPFAFSRDAGLLALMADTCLSG